MPTRMAIHLKCFLHMRFRSWLDSNLNSCVFSLRLFACVVHQSRERARTRAGRPDKPSLRYYHADDSVDKHAKQMKRWRQGNYYVLPRRKYRVRVTTEQEEGATRLSSGFPALP